MVVERGYDEAIVDGSNPAVLRLLTAGLSVRKNRQPGHVCVCGGGQLSQLFAGGRGNRFMLVLMHWYQCL